MHNNKEKWFSGGLLIILFTILLMFWLVPVTHAADSGIEFIPQTTIPNSNFNQGKPTTIEPDTLGNYINSVYQYGVGVVAVLAVVMIMLGGFKWIFSGGNAERISSAKGTITNAIVGLVLVLTSYLLLSTINPDLVNLVSLKAPPPPVIASDCPMLENNTFVRQCADFNKISKNYIDQVGTGQTKQDYCLDAEALKACGLPEKLCYWDDGSDLCASIVDKACQSASDCVFNFSSDAPEGVASESSYETYICETKTDHCSLGVEGSYCNGPDECSGANLICFDNKCASAVGGFLNGTWDHSTPLCPDGYVRAGSLGDAAGYCVKQAPECNVDADCSSNSGEYAGWISNGMFANSNDCEEDSGVKRCDCDADSGCASDNCINTFDGHADVCYPD